MEVRAGDGGQHVVGRVALIEAVRRLLVEDVVNLPHTAHQISQAHLLRDGGGPGGPGFLRGLGRLLHLRRRGAGADGVGEDVHLREGAPADKVQGGGELLLRLPGEAHD